MIDNVNNIANTQVSANDTGIKNKASYSPSMKGNPNAVDTTPTADTYQSQPASIPTEQKSSNPFGKAAYIIPTWFVLNEGTKLFNRACGGEYEKSLVGRLGQFGDKVSGTSLVRNSFVDRLKSTGSTIRRNFQAFVDKHPMLSAMDKTPTKPENSMPKSFMETQAEADIKEAAGKLDKFIEKTPKSLKEAGATKAEIEALKAKYGTNIFGQIKNSEAAIQEFQLTKFGGPNILDTITKRQAALGQQLQRYETYYSSLAKDDPLRNVVSKRIARIKELRDGYKTTTLRNVKLNAIGLNGTTYEAIKQDPTKAAARLESALEKAKGFSPRLSQYFNKIKSINAPTTKLGKFLPKLAKLGMRGLTFGGGTFNTLFIAFMMGESVKNMIDAPKEQKAGTIASGLLEAMSWVVSMPIALGAMHKIGGLQYTGLSKGQVEAYRTAKAAFDAQAKAGNFLTKEAYNSAKESVNALKKVSGKQSWFTKLGVNIGKLVSIGLEQFTPFKETAANAAGKGKFARFMGNLGRKMPNFLRNCAGYPLRFGLYMFAFAPVVDKLFSGVTSAIFGKPYDPEKVKEEQEKEAARKAALYPGPSIMPIPGADRNVGSTDLNTLSNNNLVKQKVLGVKPSDIQTPVYPTAAPAQSPAIQTQTVPSYNEPFMPPVQPNNNNQAAMPAPQNGQQAQKDPNKSEYDTVPRSYVPQLDFNNPIPYSDPMANPYAEKNYDSAQKLADKADKLGDDVEAFLKGM
ncbi:MAG: hypothetical protein NC200_05590 [Candidatus Gastranaerophilales bacterium]|nr:hypothetical protein [Candidatus Gastranaerophilales bacterium]